MEYKIEVFGIFLYCHSNISLSLSNEQFQSLIFSLFL